MRKLLILWKQHCSFNNAQSVAVEDKSNERASIDELSFWDL
ncbi:hypothetical protein ABFY54_29040 [Priestia megaterium]